MRPAGQFGEREAWLGWVLLGISSVVVVVIAVLVLAAALRPRAGSPDLIRPAPGETTWITVGGAIIPALILAAAFVYSVVTTSAITSSQPPAAISILVTGHQWWWEVNYPGLQPAQSIATANEIHIPAGVPVRIELRSADVIHSFWIPQLAGKTDVIPGHPNLAWIQADTPGVYRGMCAEYCGSQHGNMGLIVVADSPDRFRVWRESQLASAVQPTDPDQAIGRAVFEHSPCVGCHTIRGTPALGKAGPDLTHLASRQQLAAGAAPNTRGFLAGWIADPQGIKPGNHMPRVPLTAQQLQGVLAYLESLY